VSARVLVAGIGNVFLGDDGFGVEVARRLAREELPAGVTVTDVGIRALHLAFALLDGPDLLVVVDAVGRGGPPGTLYLIEPDLRAALGPARELPDAHGMNVATVLAAVRGLGGELPRTLIVGCEPGSLAEGMGLSPAVEGSVPLAAKMVRSLLEQAVPPTHAAEETRP
jgi:hydrogenase maturation protease